MECTCRLADGQPKSCTKNVFFLQNKAVGHMTFGNWPTGQHKVKSKFFHLQLSIFFKIINILYQRRVKVNIQNNPTLYYICKLY